MPSLHLKKISPLVLSLLISACGGGGGDSSSSKSQPEVNQFPSVNAGTGQTVNENTDVSLLGTASDSDGTIASYKWIQASGASVILNDINSVSTSFTSPEVTSSQVLTFNLTVTDNKGATKTDTTSITVNNVNKLPTADAGADQTASRQDLVALDGTSNDIDGSIVQYKWSQTSGTIVTLDAGDTNNATFTADNITEDETLVFLFTVTDNEGAEVSDSINIVVKDTPPQLSADKTLVEVNPASGEVLVLSGSDDLTQEGDLYNSLQLECERDPNESFNVSINYNEISFTTMGSRPNFIEECIASVTDSSGQIASITFTLKNLEDSAVPVLAFDGPIFLTPGQTIEVTVIGDTSNIDLPISVKDQNYEPIDNLLTASFENDKLTITSAENAQFPDEGVVAYIEVMTHSEFRTRGRGNNHSVRLVKSIAPYENLIEAVETVENIFKHSQDYYHLEKFIVDYAQNNQLITLEEYEDKQGSIYPPSPNNANGFYQAEKATNNLVNYLPSEVIELTNTLNNRGDNDLNYDYHYWDVIAFAEQNGTSNFPIIPGYQTKQRFSDGSFSNLIGDTKIGSYIDNKWIFNTEYQYLQAVVDTKYWLNLKDGTQTTSSQTSEVAMKISRRVEKEKLIEKSVQELLVYPLGYRSSKQITPRNNTNKNTVSIQSINEPAFNDPYFKDQLWMKEQLNYKGAQSLLNLKSNFTEVRTSRIAVVDGNFIPTNEINFAEGFDAIEMDNDPYVSYEEAKTGDYGFHGMAVSSVIGAISNNNYGIAGALTNVEITPIRVFANGRFGKGSDVANAIRWAAGHSFEGVEDISAPVDVINLSLGGQNECGQSYQSAIDFALSKGVIVVASSGNSHDNIADAPANCNGSIAVGANDINGNRADFSNYDINGIIDASAVGVEVPAISITVGETAFEETIGLWDGTSFSGPIVASVLALIKQNIEGVPAALAQQHIKSSSGAFNRECSDCGPGITNSEAAVDSALAQPVKVTATVVNKYHDFTTGYKRDYLQAQIDNGADACSWWGISLDNDIVFDSEHKLRLSNDTEQFALVGVDNQFYDSDISEVTLELCTEISCIATLEITNTLSKPGICQ